MNSRMNVKLDADAHDKLKNFVDGWNETAERELGSSHRKLTLGEALSQAIDYFVSHPSQLLLKRELQSLEEELAAKQREVLEKFEAIKSRIHFESEDDSITFTPSKPKPRGSRKRRKSK